MLIHLTSSAKWSPSIYLALLAAAKGLHPWGIRSTSQCWSLEEGCRAEASSQLLPTACIRARPNLLIHGCSLSGSIFSHLSVRTTAFWRPQLSWRDLRMQLSIHDSAQPTKTPLVLYDVRIQTMCAMYKENQRDHSFSTMDSWRSLIVLEIHSTNLLCSWHGEDHVHTDIDAQCKHVDDSKRKLSVHQIGSLGPALSKRNGNQWCQSAAFAVFVWISRIPKSLLMLHAHAPCWMSTWALAWVPHLSCYTSAMHSNHSSNTCIASPLLAHGDHVGEATAHPMEHQLLPRHLASNDWRSSNQTFFHFFPDKFQWQKGHETPT